MRIEIVDTFQKENLKLSLDMKLDVEFTVIDAHIYDETHDKRLYYGKLSSHLRRDIVERIRQTLENMHYLEK